MMTGNRKDQIWAQKHRVGNTRQRETKSDKCHLIKQTVKHWQQRVYAAIKLIAKYGSFVCCLTYFIIKFVFFIINTTSVT